MRNGYGHGSETVVYHMPLRFSIESASQVGPRYPKGFDPDDDVIVAKSRFFRGDELRVAHTGDIKEHGGAFWWRNKNCLFAA